MKVLLGISALVLVALSIVADYKWKQWIAKRQRDRDPLPHDQHRDN